MTSCGGPWAWYGDGEPHYDADCPLATEDGGMETVSIKRLATLQEENKLTEILNQVVVETKNKVAKVVLTQVVQVNQEVF